MEEEFLVNTCKSKLRLRDAPEDGKILTQLPHGKRVVVLDRSRGDGWWRVKVQGQWFSASEGWVASGYLVPVDPSVEEVMDLNVAAAIYRLCPKAKPSIVNGVAPVLAEEFRKQGFKSPVQIAHFLAQCAVESAYYTSVSEKYNGTPEKHFAKYEPGTKLGADLGNTTPGDGPLFRGRGLIQLTGRRNYTACSEALGIDIVSNPDLARDPAMAARTALWFWSANNIAALTDGASKDDVLRVSSVINRGWNPASGKPPKEPYHRSEREKMFTLALQIAREAIVPGHGTESSPMPAPAREPQGAPGHSGPAAEGPISDAPMNSGPASEAPTPAPAPEPTPVEEPAPAPAPEPVAAEPSPAPEPIVVAPPLPEEPPAPAEDEASVAPIPAPEQPSAQPPA
jgi:putative chitinase